MSRFWTLLKGIGLGAGAMYLFDPQHGFARRSRLRSQVMHASLALADEADQLVSASGCQVCERVSQWGEQIVQSVLPPRQPADSEINDAPAGPGPVIHEPANDAAADPRPWPSNTRLLAGAVGGLLLAYGATRRAPTACVLGTAGLALLAESLMHPSRCDRPQPSIHEPPSPLPTEEQPVDSTWHVATP